MVIFAIYETFPLWNFYVYGSELHCQNVLLIHTQVYDSYQMFTFYSHNSHIPYSRLQQKSCSIHSFHNTLIHLPCCWTLPQGNNNMSNRMMMTQLMWPKGSDQLIDYTVEVFSKDDDWSPSNGTATHLECCD